MKKDKTTKAKTREDTPENPSPTQPTKEAKPEIERFAPVREFDMTKTVITAVGSSRAALERYEIGFLIPQTDEEAQERYGTDLQGLVSLGLKTIATRIGYKDVGFNEDGSLKSRGHELMQELADLYRVNSRRERSAAQKIEAEKAQKIAAYCSEKGLNLDEVLANIEAAGNL